MDSNMYVDSGYAELIKDVNSLKYEIAERIVEKEWLETYVMPEIKFSYILRLGTNEADAFKEQIKLDKIKRKMELINENSELADWQIEEVIQKEFKKADSNYRHLKKDIDNAIEYTRQDRLSDENINKMNQLYKELIIYLNPALNLNNDELANQLYDEVQKAYKTSDVASLIEIKFVCLQNSIDANVIMADYEELVEIKDIYTHQINEYKKAIFDIRSSDMFSNKAVLENESLVRRRKDQLKDKAEICLNEYNELLEKYNSIISK